MTDEFQDFAALRKDAQMLRDLVGILGQRLRMVEGLQTKALEDLRKELDLIHKNQHFLYERVAPMFKAMYPDNWKYQIEFDRVLGIDPPADPPLEKDR